MILSAAALARCTAACMACLCAACASPGAFDPSPPGRGLVRTPAGQTLSPRAAMESITLGKSTRADVSAALGAAIVIPFDSGHEVWVYRWPGPDRTTRGATELVLLFEPRGVVTKLRVRPGYAARP